MCSTIPGKLLGLLTGSTGKAISFSMMKSYLPPFCFANGVCGDLQETRFMQIIKVSHTAYKIPLFQRDMKYRMLAHYLIRLKQRLPLKEDYFHTFHPMHLLYLKLLKLSVIYMDRVWPGSITYHHLIWADAGSPVLFTNHLEMNEYKFTIKSKAQILLFPPAVATYTEWVVCHNNHFNDCLRQKVGEWGYSFLSWSVSIMYSVSMFIEDA